AAGSGKARGPPAGGVAVEVLAERVGLARQEAGVLVVRQLLQQLVTEDRQARGLGRDPRRAGDDPPARQAKPGGGGGAGPPPGGPGRGSPAAGRRAPCAAGGARGAA